MAAVVSATDYYSYYVQTANVVYITRLCQTASAIILLYDHAITFDREVDHVWTQPCSFGSISYLFIRYVGNALSILNILAFLGGGVGTVNLCVPLFSRSDMEIHGRSEMDNSCKGYFFVQSWLGVLVLFLIQLILQVRLYALYRGSRIILAVMTFGYLCEVTAMSTIMSFLDVDSSVTNQVLPGLSICADVQGPSFYHSYVFWLPVMVYDGMLCLLALWHGIINCLSGYRAERMDGVCIADGLVKGNVSYFICILVGCIVSVVIGQHLGLKWVEVSEGYPAAMEAMVGCRLILSLRLLLVQDVEREFGGVGSDAPWDVVVRSLA